MAQYDKKLRTNVIYEMLANMIISIKVFDTGVFTDKGLYAKRRTDGTLFGDTKLYISTDKVDVYDFDQNDEKYNLLTIFKAPEPHEQALFIDTYKQIPLTLKQFLVKNAFHNEGTYSQFDGVQHSWIDTTLDIYEHTEYSSAILAGAEEHKTLELTFDLKPTTGITGYDAYRYKAQELARQLDDTFLELREPSREYNSIGFMRSYKQEDFDIIVPQGIMSNIRKHDLPFLFNPDEKSNVEEVHWKYFVEKVNDEGGTVPANNKTIRVLNNKEFTIGGKVKILEAGYLLPEGVVYEANDTYTARYEKRPSMNDAFDVYLIHKNDFPIMGSLRVNTNFNNPKRLDMTYYLTFGHNRVKDAHLDELALVKIECTVA